MDKLTTAQVAKLLGVSVETVRRWIVAGKMPGVRMTDDGWYSIDRKQFEKYAAERGAQLDWSVLEKSDCPA